MAITYTWTIDNTHRLTTDGGIVKIDWTISGNDSPDTHSISGITKLSPDPSASDFISYDSVTEQNCLTWVKESLDSSAYRKLIENKINEKKSLISTGKPWAV